MRSMIEKVAWVTGAGSGIGREGALALAAAGAHVILTGRREEALRETEDLIVRDGGQAAMAPLDVMDAAAVTAAAGRIDAEHGRLDILVNSAGMNTPDRHLSDFTPEVWERTIGVNLNGATYCIGAALPIMRRQNDGLVINISSWAGRFDSFMPGAAYSASKHALCSLNASVNIEECVHGIRACAICPAEVATPIMKNRPSPPSQEDLDRMLQPEDLGKLILYVAQLPPHVCLNEILISPTWNRAYLGGAELGRKIPS